MAPMSTYGRAGNWQPMMAPMTNPERRRTPRLTLEGLAYITLDPGNGGMILNVSEEGLCFRAVVPIQGRRTIHFCLSEPNVRIEADGELAWSDETHKKGGLRFTNISAESRQQIRHWISPPADGTPTRPLPSPPKSSGAGLFNGNPARSGSGTPQMRSPKTRAQGVLKGFPGGLATGLLVSAVFSAALWIHSHPQRLGESLILWGERLGARSKLQTAPAGPHIAPQETSAAAPPSSEGISVYHPDDQASQPFPRAVKAESSQNEPQIPTWISLKAPALSPVVPVADAIDSQVLAAPSLPEIPVAPASNFSPTVLASMPPPTNLFTNRVEVSKEAGFEPSSKYLEVGKFKEKSWADRTTDRLGQLGFHATVTQRGHLWMSSYYVLVGPYTNDREFEAAHKGLASWGYKSRSLERGSRRFPLRSGVKMNGQLTLNGTPIPFDDYVVSWESYASEAVVKFEGEHSAVISTEGKLIKAPAWHQYNAFVYKRNADGSRALLEIRFGGTNQTLVFGKFS
jgi:cell division protein FtsN